MKLIKFCITGLVVSIVSLVTFIVVFFISLFLIFSCGEKGPTSTNTWSNGFKSNSEKITFLEKYVSFRRNYNNIDFFIKYQNNSNGMVQGPNDWEILVIAEIDKKDLNIWTDGFKATFVDPKKILSFTKKLITNINCNTVNEWYESGSKLVGLDRENGIVIYYHLKL